MISELVFAECELTLSHFFADFVILLKDIYSIVNVSLTNLHMET